MISVHDLGGHWELCDPVTDRVWPGVVPGSVHLDLLRAGEITDPFLRSNEREVAWIGERKWVYRRRFDLPDDMVGRGRVLLRFHGLDTLATVRLGGRVVLRADNMHRRWDVDITRWVVPAGNELEVTLASPLRAVRSKQLRRPLPGWWAMMCEPGVSWLRKQISNFGWDWGPWLVTSGIWRPVELVAFDGSRLDDVHVRQQHGDGAVTLSVGVWVEQIDRRPRSVVVRVASAGTVVAEGSAEVTAAAAHVPVVIENPSLWWPNGLGDQPLYDVEVDLLDGDSVVDRVRQRVGLRTLELVREPDEQGESFAFACNGLRFFAKGANWIPADAVVGRADPATLRHMVDDAAAVNMNMLRVWGGGVYEDDALYDACDERGICVWQDFMFACATYPAFDAAYLRSVEAEAADNVRRLRHHPSLALWCGNNEVEMGLVGDRWTSTTMSWTDYRRLFDEVLPDVVTRFDPDRAYWPGSPHTPGAGRHDANDPSAGDAHLWGVWHGGEPFEAYRTTTHRFVSEFGFQSLPCPATVESFTEPEDRNLTSPVLDLHQRSTVAGTSGTGHLVRYLLDWFRMPSGFEETIWQTQILQAIAVSIGVEHWRTQAPHTMGALYWQLNDCWPGWSWSSIDYHGRWKALHYAARRFFAPLLLTAVPDPTQGTITVHLCNDRPSTATGVLRLELTRADGTVIRHEQRKVQVGALRSERVAVFSAKDELAKFGAGDVLVWLELLADDEPMSSTLVTFCPPKTLALVEPRLRATLHRDGVRLESDHPALWAWPTVEDLDVRWSDSFVHVRPGRPVDLSFESKPALAVAELRRRLVVRSLFDTWRPR